MGFLSNLILRGVIKSALTLESQSIATYQRLCSKAGNGRRRSDALDENLCRLLAEEEMHRNLLLNALAGKLWLYELEAHFKDHQATRVSGVEPMDGSLLAEWVEDLSAALEHEKRTWIFYSNLRRTSRIPSVRKAFELLAFMEKAHVDILRALLGH